MTHIKICKIIIGKMSIYIDAWSTQNINKKYGGLLLVF